MPGLVFDCNPGLHFINILIRPVGKGHDVPHRTGKLATFIGVGNVPGRRDILLTQTIVAGAACEHAIEAFINKSGATAGDID